VTPPNAKPAAQKTVQIARDTTIVAQADDSPAFTNDSVQASKKKQHEAR
jgi:hypothetical protein